MTISDIKVYFDLSFSVHVIEVEHGLTKLICQGKSGSDRVGQLTAHRNRVLIKRKLIPLSERLFRGRFEKFRFQEESP